MSVLMTGTGVTPAGRSSAFAGELKGLGSGAGTFVTAPASGSALQQPASDRLWRAIQQDSIAAYAKRYPGTVTPAAVP
jgi:hypothetical protein